MNCGGRGLAATVRCRQCSASITGAPGARAVHCSQCGCVTRIPGAGRVARPAGTMVRLVPPSRSFGGGRGTKRAVLIGIKYTGRRGSELRGPVNDVKCMSNLLTERFGFEDDCVIILTDEERDPCRLPTRDNILNAMRWLVHGCRSADSLVFQFSGMGAQVTDMEGDERDGLDEAICPMDYYHQGPILDDEINEAIVAPLVQGVKLHAVVDAWHSTTVLDLPYNCVVPKTGGCFRWKDERPLNGDCKGTSGGKAVLISGSSNGSRKRTDLVPDPCATIGAMTHSFIRALECEPRPTYRRLLTSMRNTMRQGNGTCNVQGTGCGPVRKVANFSGVEEPHLSSAQMFDIDHETFCI